MLNVDVFPSQTVVGFVVTVGTSGSVQGLRRVPCVKRILSIIPSSTPESKSTSMINFTDEPIYGARSKSIAFTVFSIAKSFISLPTPPPRPPPSVSRTVTIFPPLISSPIKRRSLAPAPNSYVVASSQ